MLSVVVSRCCAVLRTGSFATGSEDGTIRVWSDVDEVQRLGVGRAYMCGL